MARTLQPLSLGRILDETFNIYRHNFILFIGISAIPNLVLLLLQIAAARLSIHADPHGLTSSLDGLGTWVASLIAESAVVAATTFAVSDIYLDTPTSMSACFSRVGGKLRSVIYVSIATGLLIGFGILLCVAPGVYWAGVYGIAMPAVVLENISGRQAMSRSSALTKNSVGRVLVIYFLTTIFAVLMAMALGAALSTFEVHSFQTPLGKEIVDDITTTLSGIFLGPISAIALTLAYYDQRVRNEAFDIEHMMSLMGIAPAALPPPVP